VQGKTNLDFNTLRTQLTDSIRAQVENDPRFGGVTSLSVSQVPTPDGLAPRAVAVYLTVRLSGSSTEVPINFSINA
jgi:hypothetical protein